VAATEADVQLFWGEPPEGVAARIARLRDLEQRLGRDLPPLRFGLRVTTLVRDTTEEAWRDAEARLHALAERGDVLDSCLYTAPGRYGAGGAGTTWLVGSAEDVAAALRRYADLGVSHFVLSDTPYAREIARVGDRLLPLLREPAAVGAR
jgi:alkanesulfonate monooxygenase